MQSIGEGTLLARPKGSVGRGIKIDRTVVGCQGGTWMEDALSVAILQPNSLDDSVANSDETQHNISSFILK